MEKIVPRIPYLFGKTISSDNPSFMHISDPWIFKQSILHEIHGKEEKRIMRRAMGLAEKEH